jgi:citrate synthase
LIKSINMNEYIGRSDALTRLGVKPQTLYAYVSRGLIGVRADPADPRRSLYRLDDIDVLRARRSRGRARATVATGAIAWGEPALETTISTVHHGRLLYRGQDAVALAAHATWEEAARLIWNCNRVVRLEGVTGTTDPFVALAALVGDSYPMPGRPLARLFEDAQRAIDALASSLGAAPSRDPLHVRLACGWSADRFAEPLRRALVLLADHELNASTFAVRVAASTGAPMAAGLLAGLATLSGPRHGTAGIEALLMQDEARRRGPRAVVARYLGSGQRLPGFDHPLYPSGDPRASALRDALPEDALLDDLCAEALSAADARPNIDFALAALTRAAGLPDTTPFHLFALGRSIGWVAQAIEQLQNGTLIRPRARYAGVLPD